jgi:hypothetical protein
VKLQTDRWGLERCTAVAGKRQPLVVGASKYLKAKPPVIEVNQIQPLIEHPMDQNAEQHFPKQDPERIETIRRIAYHLWLARREYNLLGDADQDYFQAERIFESKTRRLLVSSFCLWSVTCLTARFPEAILENDVRIAEAFDGLSEEYDHTWDQSFR